MVPWTLAPVQAGTGAVTPPTIADMRDPKIMDDAVTALKLPDKGSGAVIGPLVSYGNHPETTSDVNSALSSDYVDAIRNGMENGLFKSDGTKVADGLGGISLFIQGSVGGMMSTLDANPMTLDGTVPPARSFAKAQAACD